MNNPIAAVDAILQTDKNVARATIRPLTLARYALLELVDSPMIKASAQTSTSKLVPTLYIMTASIEDLAGFDSSNIEQLKKAAIIWADSIDGDQTEQLISEACRQLGLMAEVAPDASESNGEHKGKKAQTAGC